MDPKHTHRQTTQQASSETSHQQHSTADVNSQRGKHDQSRAPVSYHHDGDIPSRDDTAADSRIVTDRISDSSCSNTASDSDKEKKTVMWDSGVAHQANGEDIPPTQPPQTEDSSQTSGCSPPRSPPPLERSNSSSVSTVCRPSHSHLEVKCQVNSHDLPDLSFACPAAFSPQWTRWVQPALSSSRSKNGSHASERRRRHTVAGPTTPAQLQHLEKRHQQALHPHLHRGSFQGTEGHDPIQLTLQGLGRSLSDSELQHLLMKEVGQKLRKMSDEFHFFKTGERLSTVSESTGSEDDTDDEM